MRTAQAALRNRSTWAGLALGCALAAAAAFVWSRGPQEAEANARGSEPASPGTISPARSGIEAPSVPAETASASQPPSARFEDYFSRNYSATYSYASPAYAPADWSRAGAPSAAPPPPSIFTLPSVTDLLGSAKVAPDVPTLAVPSASLSDVSTLAPAAKLSVPAPSAPAGLLTNNTPFHLFVTSDPVTAASSTASGAPSITSSGSTAGTVGTATGAVSTVTGAAGSLLRK
jgi:hypothetical protein